MKRKTNRRRRHASTMWALGALTAIGTALLLASGLETAPVTAGRLTAIAACLATAALCVRRHNRVAVAGVRPTETTETEFQFSEPPALSTTAKTTTSSAA